MAEITPNPSYNSYPVTDIPENGQVLDATVVQAIYQDIYNRISYLKNSIDSSTTKLSNSEIKTGLSYEDSVLPVFDSNYLLNINKNYKQALETLDTFLSTVTQKFNNLGINLGSSTLESSPLTYTVPAYLETGDSHHISLEKLATELYDISALTTALVNDYNLLFNRVNNIKDKISTTADQVGIGLTYSSTNFVVNGNQIDQAVSTLDKVALSNKRINEANYRDNLLLWAELNSNTNEVFFDTLYSNVNINANSTENGYDFYSQSFGRSDISWVYYSNIFTVPSGTNTIKMKLNGYGTVTPYVALHGNYGGTFTFMTAMDTWITVPSGTQLIVRVNGGIGAKLYSYSILHKVV